ncbi:MAG: SusC/RagA family TonB-linked outer membrane protein [Pseudobacter sp.]|uniref:SusC/RagA family TonB-linked outer membrane protein n=1 Tax=Pseudobacter sp. TaxID=2045420 RepID=UPI003F81988A
MNFLFSCNRIGVAAALVSFPKKGMEQWAEAPADQIRFSKKLLRIMKLTALFMLLLGMHVSAKSLSQTVTFSGKDQPLEKVLAAVKKQTGFVFLYDGAILRNAKPVSIHAKDQSLRVFLDAVLKGQSLDYSIENTSVIISASVRSPKTERIPELMVYPVFQTITGTILSADGTPLAGASVKIKGTSNGTSAGAKGEFIINANPGQILVFSFIGYQDQEMKVAEQTVLTVTLKPSESKLEEFVFKGYYATSKKLNTGSVSSIKSSEISKVPVSNPLQALSGRLAGVFVSESDGSAGAGINVQIRGRNSITGGTLPLYIIDGVPFNGTPMERRGGLAIASSAVGSGLSPLNSISPADIESMEILKDADATAIYGSRAANGVVLITTKKGKTGKTKVDVNFYTGMGKVNRFLKLASLEQYLDVRRQAFENDGYDPDAATAPDLIEWDQKKGLDFQREIMGETNRITDANVSISGGNQFTSFLMSGNYHHETAVYNGDFGNKKGSFLLNLNHRSQDGKFNATASVNYSRDKNLLPSVDLNFIAWVPPNYPVYNPDGSLFWNGVFDNPMASLMGFTRAETDNLITNVSLSYNLTSDLKIKTALGYNKIYNKQFVALPTAARDPYFQGKGLAVFSSHSSESLIIEPQVDYTKNLGPGKFTALAGGTFQSILSVQPFMMMGEFSSDVLMENLGTYLGSGTSIQTLSSNETKYRYASVFARGSYNLDNKYILNVSYRRDGSSRFAPGKQFGDFGAIGAAWIFSEENQVKDNLPWLSFGKLRGSIGTVGNDQIPDYQYLSTYTTTPLIPSYGSTPALYPSRIRNPNLVWESTKKIELALELGFLQDRLLMTLSAYRHRSNNMLVSIPLGSQAGFTSYRANLPAEVENTGLELELNATMVKRKDFSWNAMFNISIPRNKLVKYDGLSSSTFAGTYQVGKSLDMIPAYVFSEFKDGVPVVKDLNGDKVITPGLFANGTGDMVAGGKTNPDYFGGLNNSLRYKGWQLDFLFQFVKQQGANIAGSIPGNQENFPAYLLNRGFKPTTDYQEAFISHYLKSDAVILDASYIRLKNVSLSYQFSGAWMEKMKLSNFRVFMLGKNLFTQTDYPGIDPETQAYNLGVIKMVTLGVQCSF